MHLNTIQLLNSRSLCLVNNSALFLLLYWRHVVQYSIEWICTYTHRSTNVICVRLFAQIQLKQGRWFIYCFIRDYVLLLNCILHVSIEKIEVENVCILHTNACIFTKMNLPFILLHKNKPKTLVKSVIFFKLRSVGMSL